MFKIRASLMIFALSSLLLLSVACGRSEPESAPAPESSTTTAVAPSPETPPATPVPEPSTSSLPEQKTEGQESEMKKSESRDLLTESTVAKGPDTSSAAGESAQSSAPAGRRATLLFSTSVVGSRVRGMKGNEVGKIKDLLFDPNDRRIVYAIVSLSNKDVAVPLSAIKIDPERHNYTLEMSDESLAGAPQVGKDKKLSPELTDPARYEGAKSSSSSAMKEPAPSISKEPSSTATKDRFAPSTPMKDSKSGNP